MIHTRLLHTDDLDPYRRVTLRALRERPEAFGMSPEEFETMTDEAVLQQLTSRQPDNGVIGAFIGDTLVGIVSVNRHPRQKTRQRALLGSMYCLPEQRGQGIGRALLQVALDHIRTLEGVEHVVLAVTAGNETARRMYRRAGFVTWGVDPAYIRVGADDYDIEWMVLWL